ncbi:MAG: YdeI/OmpD-associated family protein [Pseudomonadota bacterium]
MDGFYPHIFTATVVHHDVGSEKYRYSVVFVPEDIKSGLPLSDFPKLRITGEVEDFPIEAALTPVRGQHYILLSRKLLTSIRKSLGDEVTVRFRIADQDAVDVPHSLESALAKAPAVKALWDDASPGKRRALAYMIASAKREATQNKRIEKVFAILEGRIDMKGNPI